MGSHGRKPPVDDPNYDHLISSSAEKWAVGLPAIVNSAADALTEMGPLRSVKLLTSINQKDGFDCMSCAWPDPDHRKIAEFCENGARAVTWEATPVTVPTSFWAEHSVTDLLDKSEYWLGMQGRLVEPVYKPRGSDHYEPVSWDRRLRHRGRSPPRARLTRRGGLLHERAHGE